MAIVLHDADHLIIQKYLNIVLEGVSAGRIDSATAENRLAEIIAGACEDNYQACLGHMREIVDGISDF